MQYVNLRGYMCNVDAEEVKEEKRPEEEQETTSQDSTRLGHLEEDLQEYCQEGGATSLNLI